MVDTMCRIIFIGIFFISVGLYAQQKKDFVFYNQQTYTYYINKEWDKLIDTAEESIKNDIDFYYLRIRLGIAYFKQKSYSNAVIHLRRSLEFNAGDPVALEYLYYSYLYSDRYSDAIHIYGKYRNILKDLTEFHPKFFDRILPEGGIKISDHDTRFETEAGAIQYGQLGLLHVGGKNLYLFHYAGYLNHEFEDKFSFQNSSFDIPYDIGQFEYYIKAGIIPASGWELYPIYHFIRVKTPSSRYNDNHVALGVMKSIRRIKLGINVGLSDINQTRFYQYEPKLNYYPLGNNEIYLKSSAILTSGDLEQQSIQGLIGVHVFKTTWMEGFYTFGKTRYSAVNDGYTIYNNPDYVLSRGGMLIYQYFNLKSSLTLSYQLERKERVDTGKLYHHHVLLIGLNFKL